MTARSGTAGFALIEALSALVITSLVLLTLSISAGLLLRNWERTVHDAESFEEMSTGLEVLRTDLRMVARLQWDGVPEDGILFRGDEAGLTLTAARGADGSGRGYSLIVLGTESRRDLNALVRVSAPLIPGQGIAVSPGGPVDLITGPWEFRFAYKDAERGAGDAWRPTWQQGNGIPAAIRLSIFDPEAEREVMPPLVVAPHVDAEPGCIDGNDGYCSFDPEREEEEEEDDEGDERTQEAGDGEADGLTPGGAPGAQGLEGRM